MNVKKLLLKSRQLKRNRKVDLTFSVGWQIK